MAIETGDPRVDEQLRIYEQAIQNACAKALAGDITRRELEAELISLSTDNTLTMFLLGGGSLATKEARDWLDKQNIIHINSARKLAKDVFNGRYSMSDDGDNQES